MNQKHDVEICFFGKETKGVNFCPETLKPEGFPLSMVPLRVDAIYANNPTIVIVENRVPDGCVRYKPAVYNLRDDAGLIGPELDWKNYYYGFYAANQPLRAKVYDAQKKTLLDEWEFYADDLIKNTTGLSDRHNIRNLEEDEEYLLNVELYDGITDEWKNCSLMFKVPDHRGGEEKGIWRKDLYIGGWPHPNAALECIDPVWKVFYSDRILLRSSRPCVVDFVADGKTLRSFDVYGEKTILGIRKGIRFDINVRYNDGKVGHFHHIPNYPNRDVYRYDISEEKEKSGYVMKNPFYIDTGRLLEYGVNLKPYTVKVVESDGMMPDKTVDSFSLADRFILENIYSHHHYQCQLFENGTEIGKWLFRADSENRCFSIDEYLGIQPGKYCVYTYYDKDMNVLYVGETSVGSVKRFKRHKSSGDPYIKKVAFVKVVDYLTDRNRHNAQNVEIAYQKGLHNKAENQTGTCQFPMRFAYNGFQEEFYTIDEFLQREECAL